ncbi:putative HVA22-like protein g isoform X1 [Zingiber officinale]|uniref:putative HVA22-like protein g isoform X1 n=1 Tax=Zingiber officinale TaxID=94328 RepID=UPI001C4C92FE|nr:putative HVA22-like protein g isoform X1 [Zingiber officinale]
MCAFFTRALLMVFGYVYPAYDCYKTVELNRPEIEQLRFWCQYWILVAILSVLERIGDTFISWFPMYSEAKLAFYIYLWYPKTKGTTYIYQNFLRPFIAKHETEIDRTLLEFKTRAGDVMVQFWQKAAKYGQTRFSEILHYLASQSQSPRKHTVQLGLSQQGSMALPNPIKINVQEKPMEDLSTSRSTGVRSQAQRQTCQAAALGTNTHQPHAGGKAAAMEVVIASTPGNEVMANDVGKHTNGSRKVKKKTG